MMFSDFSLIRGAKKQSFSYWERLHQANVADPCMWYADAGLFRVRRISIQGLKRKKKKKKKKKKITNGYF
jgi:hypothetical protein